MPLDSIRDHIQSHGDILSQFSDQLAPMKKLSSIFPQQPLDDHLQIIIKTIGTGELRVILQSERLLIGIHLSIPQIPQIPQISDIPVWVFFFPPIYCPCYCLSKFGLVVNAVIDLIAPPPFLFVLMLTIIIILLVLSSVASLYYIPTSISLFSILWAELWLQYCFVCYLSGHPWSIFIS